MSCPKCGAPVDAQSSFCSACGEPLNTPETPSQPTPASFDARLNKSRRRTGLWIGAAVAVVVVGIGTAGAAVTHPFATGKSLLVTATKNAKFASGTSSQQIWHLKLKNINAPGLPQPQAGLVSTLNNATIDLSVFFKPTDKQAEVDFSTQYQNVAHKGSLWVSKDSLVLSAQDYQSLLASAVPGIQLPKYLVSDATQAKGITDFWNQMQQDPKKMTDTQLAAAQDLANIVVAAIPDKYVHRTGLTSISIEFDQAGLEDILNAEVRAVYSNKDKVADDVGVLSAQSQLQAGMSSADIRKSVLDAMNQMPVEQVLAGIGTVFNAGIVSTDPTTISFTKSIFGGGYSEHVSGGISFTEPSSNTSAAIEYTVDATTPAAKNIEMPKVDSKDSQTFTDWSGSLGTH